MENQQQNQQQNERRMMSEEYGSNIEGCILIMMACVVIIAIGIAGIIYLFT